jgi:hypothetical protein
VLGGKEAALKLVQAALKCCAAGVCFCNTLGVQYCGLQRGVELSQHV